MDLIRQIKEQASRMPQTIILPEASDERVLQAANICQQEKLAKIILLGDEKDIEKKIKLKSIEVLNHKKNIYRDDYARQIIEIHKDKEELVLGQVLDFLDNPVVFGTMHLRAKKAAGQVAGAITTTANVLRPALKYVRKKKDCNLVSGLFIALLPKEFGENGIMGMADCAVNPDPSAEQLAEIAIKSAENFQNLTNLQPKVAMLSFSTKSSSKHNLAKKVAEATSIAQSLMPKLLLDGEIQLDAALIPEVAASKAPSSPVAGKANLLIFPDLNSGNIGYKIIQRLGKAQVIGPIIQGMNSPVNDLSRGCSVDEIVNLIAITAVQAQHNAA